MNCGREKGGLMVDILGECPVASAMKYDGQNGGIAAGRACWEVKGSACKRRRNARACHNCEFYRRVVFEQDEKTRYRFTSVSA